MKPRFRIRTREGLELEPRTVESLVELVRSRVIRPEDLVFDGLTGEWAPARTHTALQDLTAELGESPFGAAEEEGPAAGVGASAAGGRPEGSAGGVDVDEWALDLVEPPPAAQEQARRRMIERLEAERQREGTDSSGSLKSEPYQASDPVLDSLDPPRWRRGAPAAPARPATAPPDSPEPAAKRSLPPTPPQRRRRRGQGVSQPSRSWTLAFGLPLLALAVSATVARPSFRVGETMPGTLSAAEPASEERLVRPVAAREATLRARAYDGLVSAVRMLGEDLGVAETPSDWLEGWYLADPAAYPEVRRFWERYLAFAEAAHAGEGRMYREAYLEAAAEAGLTGPLRSLRLAAAVEDFEAGRLEREGHYTRVWDMAAAALALHDELVTLKGRIRYEPARGLRLSVDPVIEAAGTDPEAQARLETGLDAVLESLAGSAGDAVRDRDALPLWLAEGLAELAPPSA